MKRFWNWAEAVNSKSDGGEPDSAASPASRHLYLYGTIAEESWLEDDVTPDLFRQELMAGDGPVTVWLNSCGGDCVAASQIYAMLIDYKGPVTVIIDGIAASAASVVAMAGTTVLMAPTSCMMIHDPMTAAVGNEADMEKAIEMLSAVKDSIIDAYEIKTGLDRRTLAKMMSAETWMDARKAIELGFADGVLERTTNAANGRDDADIGSTVVFDIVEPVLFSQRSVDMALVNRLTGHSEGIVDITEDGSTTEPSVSDETNDDDGKNTDGKDTDGKDPVPGIPVQPLYDRLESLRDD